MRDNEAIIANKRNSLLLGFFAAVLGLVLCWPAPSTAQVFTAPSAFILTQTYEDPSLNIIEAHLLLRKDGELIDSSDINWVELRDSQGTEMIPSSGPEFKRTEFILATWDPLLGWSRHISGYSGFVMRFLDQASGTYTFEAATTTGETITADAGFPGRLELTPVSSSSMFSNWLPDGSLFLSWGEPVGDSEFQQYRVMFLGPQGNEIFSGRISRGVNEVVIPPDLLQEIRGLAGTGQVTWFMRTLKRLASGDYARSHSNALSITLPPSEIVGPVTGQVVAEGGLPPSYMLVRLQRLEAWGWEYINQWYPDWTGTFYFNSDWYGNTLSIGTYQVEVFAPGYETALVGPRYLPAGNAWDLGTVILAPPPQANSIGGRLVDMLTGEPLPGDSTPWAGVNLIRVNEMGWNEWVGWQSTNSTGEFLFTGLNSGPLLAGTYFVEVNAQGYESYSSAEFPAVVGEDVVLGDLQIVPIPISISNIVPCDPMIPGSLCSFSFDVANRSNKRFEGAVWSIVNGPGTIDSRAGYTVFQTASKGTKQPFEKLSLKSLEIKTLTFEYPVPASLPDWAYYCADAFVGEAPDTMFKIEAMNWLFCVFKAPDGLHLVPESKMRLLRQPKQDKPKVWRDLR